MQVRAEIPEGRTGLATIRAPPPRCRIAGHPPQPVPAPAAASRRCFDAVAGLVPVGVLVGDREENSGALLEAAPGAIVGVAEDGRIALVNAQAERLFGCPRAELPGRPVEILVPDAAHELHPGHRGLPVTDGVRYCCLTFLYDEAAARLRVR